jgi:hypothetical protein
VLIATKVAEEGLDFRACNLVVRFDALTTVTGYVEHFRFARSQITDSLARPQLHPEQRTSASCRRALCRPCRARISRSEPVSRLRPARGGIARPLCRSLGRTRRAGRTGPRQPTHVYNSSRRSSEPRLCSFDSVRLLSTPQGRPIYATSETDFCDRSKFRRLGRRA